jgi:cytochrome oxidase assembly protein ShyY1
MTTTEPSPKLRGKESHAIVATALALLLISLCLWASHWQYKRGVARHHRNFVIASHVDQPMTTLDAIEPDVSGAEWRKVSVTGRFDPDHQILLRNQYSQGAYGFDLLTLFTDSRGRTFWVDRGWIAPGKSATVTPPLPETSTNVIALTGRIRLENSLPQGSFFAINPGSRNLISKWNAQSKNVVKTESFYVDLLTVSDPKMTPAVPVELPELTDGPHMAYALQWLFFAGLVGYGRLLLRRAR